MNYTSPILISLFTKKKKKKTSAHRVGPDHAPVTTVQTVFGERYLVFGPILVHTTSALLKRLFSSPPPPRPLSSALSTTGYACVLLPIHIFTHRLALADPSPPISSLSPSELDFEYVKAALHGWLARSTVLYVALVLGVALHAADGLVVVWATWVPKAAADKLPGRRARQALAGGAVLPVLTGLAVIVRSPLCLRLSLRWRGAGLRLLSHFYTACEKKSFGGKSDMTLRETNMLVRCANRQRNEVREVPSCSGGDQGPSLTLTFDVPWATIAFNSLGWDSHDVCLSARSSPQPFLRPSVRKWKAHRLEVSEVDVLCLMSDADLMIYDNARNRPHSYKRLRGQISLSSKAFLALPTTWKYACLSNNGIHSAA